MSGAQTSTFADPNVLLNTLSGATTTNVVHNQLLNTEAQQNIAATDMDQVSRAANWIDTLPAEQKPQAYQAARAQLQSAGFAKNAPTEYPGDQAITMLARQSLPVADQYKLGVTIPPGLTAALQGNRPPAQGGPPSAQGGPPGLATAESGGRSDVINAQGYTGTYQFGKQRLADLGYYAPAPGENMNDNTNWQGKVSVPGFNVTDQKSFAANPAAQQVVYQAHMANIDQAIDQMPNAANFDRNGLRAVAHLGGIAGMERFASSGGMYDPADANGTRLSTYYKRFSGGAPAQPGSTTAVATTGTPPASTSTATATPGGGPVVLGDSLASRGGLGGSGVVGASPSAVRAQIAQGVQNGAYTGKDVVLSSGASNAPGDMENVEAQLKQLRDASSVTLLGVGPAIEAKNPGTNAKLATLAAQYGAKFQPLPGDQMSPDGVHPNAAGYATLKTATAPPGAAPQGGRYQVASNAQVGPPSATAAAPAPAPGTPSATPVVAQGGQPPPSTPAAPGSAPPPAQPAQPSGPQANLPHASEVPSGQNSPQYQEWQRIQQQVSQLMPYAALPAAKAKIAQLQAQQQVLMQTDSVVNTQEGQLHTMTGKIDDPAKPNANYVWDATKGSYIDTTGTHPPVTPPSPRLTITPSGDVVQSKPGGGIAVVAPASPGGIAAREAAQTGGAAIGKQTGQLTAQLADQGRASAQAIGNIDYGLSQIQKAKEGGIPTGYFAPWLGTAAAIGKSLGIDTSALGVDPAAVGNIQTAGKTLAVVSGAILQQVLGPDSQITDAKIQHFIHAQPGIETDPEALNRVLNWARSQFVYEREMAAKGMKDASDTGLLPTNWQAKYYAEHGFAPIYNPGTGEMEQPEGKAPPRQPPATTETAPVNPAARQAGTTYSTPKGPMKWDGKLWQPPGQ